MKKLTFALIGLGFAATAAHAQPAAEPATQPGGPEAATPAEPAAPAEPTTPAESSAQVGVAASAAFTDDQIDSFAAATVKVQTIDADASIAADQKQAQMRAAVTDAGLDAATYNKIGRAIATDTELRGRVQVAMQRHTGHAEATPNEG
jgi:hypothetical protein